MLFLSSLTRNLANSFLRITAQMLRFEGDAFRGFYLAPSVPADDRGEAAPTHLFSGHFAPFPPLHSQGIHRPHASDSRSQTQFGDALGRATLLDDSDVTGVTGS